MTYTYSGWDLVTIGAAVALVTLIIGIIWAILDMPVSMEWDE
jgi:hypothetical protein